jgi:hypothetical protein
MSIRLQLVAASCLAALACGTSYDSSGGQGTPGTTTGNTHNLTLSNFEAWCAITVAQPDGTSLPNGATAANNVVALPAGTVVKLHGEAAGSAFEWVPAGGRGGWSGAIDPGQDRLAKDVTVTLDGDKTVNVCCPFTNGTGC